MSFTISSKTGDDGINFYVGINVSLSFVTILWLLSGRIGFNELDLTYYYFLINFIPTPIINIIIVK